MAAPGRGNYEVIDCLVNELIFNTTGIKEDADKENYRLCHQYVWSNIKYHRFLDVNSHKVMRQVEGMCEKFAVHSQEMKRDTLQSLTSDLVQSFNNKSEEPFVMISFLLLLSDCPTKSRFTPTNCETPECSVDTFDWPRHLLDGEQVVRAFPPTPDISDDEYSSELDEPSNTRTIQPIKSQDHIQCTTTEDQTLTTPEYDWLKRHVISQYWGSDRCLLQQFGDCFLKHWATYLTQIDTLYLPTFTVATETQLIRELIWVLYGCTEAPMFVEVEGHLQLRHDVHVSHLTYESLESVASVITERAAALRSLEQFVRVMHRSCLGGATTSRTHEAFADGIAKFVQGVHRDLVALEKIVMTSDETVTLMSLLNHLKPTLDEISVLHQIYDACVRTCHPSMPIVDRSVHLLTKLYDVVSECDTLGQCLGPYATVSMKLWLITCRPYLDIIDTWISLGILQDSRNEFLFQRNSKIQSMDESFWDAAFTLHCLDSTIPADPPDTGNKHMDHPSAVPTFLKPVLSDVISAGKSMELLHNLSPTTRRDFIGQSSKVLYVTFLQSVLHRLNQEEWKIPDANLPALPFIAFNKLNHNDAMFEDSLFTENFLNICSIKTSEDQQSNVCGGSLIDKIVENLELSSCPPIHSLLRRYLYPLISSRCRLLCSALVSILNEHYKLTDYLTDIRRFFLMEAGDVMSLFCSSLFQKMDEGAKDEWKDETYLGYILEEAIQYHPTLNTSRVSISLVDSPDQETKETNPLSIFQCLHLQYEVGWPLEVVITSRCLEVYNNIFIFLLQIKRAKLSLDTLSFTDVCSTHLLEQVTSPAATDRTKTKLHLMFLLRIRLLHFVNSVHSYIMTRIIHSTSLEFTILLDSAMTLDDIIDGHTQYVTKLHEYCLLHRKVRLIKQTVMEVLSLACVFCRCWKQSLETTRMMLLEKIDHDLTKFTDFLVSVLNANVKRGSFPHLESLVSSLASSRSKS